MLERKDISLIALPVLDHKLDMKGLEAKREGFARRMQEHAFAAICRASGYEPDPPPSSESVTNKYTFNNVRTVRLNQEHTSAQGKSRSALEFFQSNGSSEKTIHLSLPTADEGLTAITGTDNPSFDKITETMCHPACIGGNIPNSGMNQLRMVDALKDIDPAIRLHFLTPSGTKIMDILENARKTMNGSLSVHSLDLPAMRKGLHIPVRYLHEGNRASTAMFNSAGPSVDDIRGSLEPYEKILRRSTVFSPDPRYGAGNGIIKLIPTSAAMSHVSLNDGYTLFVNQEELLRLCKQNNIVDSHDDKDWLPSVLRDNDFDQDALRVVNDRLVKMHKCMRGHGSYKGDQRHKRMAQIGKTDGAILDLFENENGMTALHTCALSEAMSDRVIDLAGSTRVSKHLMETTGRGDAASAAALLDEVSPKLLLQWWQQQNKNIYLKLSKQQTEVFHLVLPSIMSRIHAKVVHFCPDSNFFEVLDAKGYKRLLQEGISVASTMAAQYDVGRSLEPQILHDIITACTTAIWRVHGTDFVQN